MFTYARKLYKLLAVAVIVTGIALGIVYAKRIYQATDFGKTFGPKAVAAKKKLQGMQQNFDLCAKLCNTNAKFMQGIVFPEVMRYNSIKDGIEAESLRTLYVELGEDYANFSIGIFQMKPSFAVQVEMKAKQMLPDSLYKEFQLPYNAINEVLTRRERVNRLQDDDWQMVYLSAFIKICDVQYANRKFTSDNEKLNWYATVYNAGFDRTDDYIIKKIAASNYYLKTGMPGKKYNYAAIANWFYSNP